MTRFLIRCDDVGQGLLDQFESDRGLQFFRKWWDAGGWGDEPIYLGVVPECVLHDDEALLYLMELEANTGAEVCLHGWDHKKGILSAEDVRRAAEMFPNARCVIPPYNGEDEATIEAVAKIHPRPVLFGGIHGNHHQYGEAPVVLNGVLHLSARSDLYAHSYRMVDTVDRIPDPGYPVVVTLHLRWDSTFLQGVGKLRKALEGRMVRVDEAWPG